MCLVDTPNNPDPPPPPTPPREPGAARIERPLGSEDEDAPFGISGLRIPPPQNVGL